LVYATELVRCCTLVLKFGFAKAFGEPPCPQAVGGGTGRSALRLL
jgi:hypothetical protein